MGKNKLEKKKTKAEVLDEVIELIKNAKALLKKDKRKSTLFVKKARRLAMRHKIKLPRAIKRQFCKHCYSYLMPGENCRIRTRNKTLVYYCLDCRKYMRFPLK